MTTCVFCDRIAAGNVEARWPLAVCFEPLNPVTPGHMLVVPRKHVADVATDLWWSAVTMRAAAELAAEIGDCNVITSRGSAATQTVLHLHLHVVPRRLGDGLMLPWTVTKDDPPGPGVERRYPTRRPGWLGEYQNWPCGRCGVEHDDSAPHECVPLPSVHGKIP